MYDVQIEKRDAARAPLAHMGGRPSAASPTARSCTRSTTRRCAGSPPRCARPASRRSRSRSSTPTPRRATSAGRAELLRGGAARRAGDDLVRRLAAGRASTSGRTRPPSTPTSRPCSGRTSARSPQAAAAGDRRRRSGSCSRAAALAPAGRAAELPVRTIESGPAAGRARVRPPRSARRARGRDLARHGRHDGEGGRDPRRPARDDASVRARAAGATPRQRAPARHPGDRPRRDQRRRRLDRARAVRDPAGRPAQRRRRPGARLLRPRRHARRRSPTRTCCSAT